MESVLVASLPKFDGKLLGHALFTEWIEWKESFEVWCDAMGFDSQEKKLKWLLVAGGREIQRIYGSTPAVDGEISELRVPMREIPVFNNAVLRLESYFKAKSNPRLERQLLSEMKQGTEESINAFVVRLRIQAVRCGFDGDRVDEEVYFQIMLGAKSGKVRQYAATESEKSLENIISYAVNEEIKEQRKVKEDKVAKIAEAQPQQSSGNDIYPQVIAALRQMSRSANGRNSQQKSFTKCYRCGSMKHMGGKQCPAVEAMCHICKKVGHFARVCMKKRKEKRHQQQQANKDQINQIHVDDEDWDVVVPKMPQV
ncbi:uncharacterized protein [Chironomus tepperi]|uniref:uncharacterized protein n=1 Tax=Chironomus tepperi TaxID=113505 RepID=UPI00391F6C6D